MSWRGGRGLLQLPAPHAYPAVIFNVFFTSLILSLCWVCLSNGDYLQYPLPLGPYPCVPRGRRHTDAALGVGDLEIEVGGLHAEPLHDEGLEVRERDRRAHEPHPRDRAGREGGGAEGWWGGIEEREACPPFQPGALLKDCSPPREGEIGSSANLVRPSARTAVGDHTQIVVGSPSVAFIIGGSSYWREGGGGNGRDKGPVLDAVKSLSCNSPSSCPSLSYRRITDATANTSSGSAPAEPHTRALAARPRSPGHGPSYRTLRSGPWEGGGRLTPWGALPKPSQSEKDGAGGGAVAGQRAGGREPPHVLRTIACAVEKTGLYLLYSAHSCDRGFPPVSEGFRSKFDSAAFPTNRRTRL